MGIFDKLFGKKSSGITLGAPVAGEAVPLNQVSDPTFGEEILGKGVAVKPTGNRVVAPCDATVDLMFDTGHAVSLKADCGAEVLIHVGLETVSLKGEHFTTHAKTGDHVTVSAAGFDTITPMVICNTADYKEVNAHTGAAVSEGDTILTLVKE